MLSDYNEKPLHTAIADGTSGLVVFLVALPLCLGIALASGAPLFSGVLAGIVGGLVVGAISGSHTSVSGPAAGLTAVVFAQIEALGTFEAFLCAVFVAGLMQIAMGIARAGSIAEFFPTSVIKGLLAAIGVILILKQIPHLFGHDADPEGEMSFQQPDHENTFSELYAIIGDLHWGAAVIGLTSLALLVIYGKLGLEKRLKVPAPLIVVVIGTLMKVCFDRMSLGTVWQIEESHLVQLPVAANVEAFLGFLQMADFTQLSNPTVYTAAITIALVASLETLLNLEAVDNIDPRQRVSPPNRELIAQGVGNVTGGLVGALPVTSVIIRSSVNINSGGRTKVAAIIHGCLLLSCGMFLPKLLNLIPLSALAAILLMTGIKLASPKLVQQMWRGGKDEFIPFIVTVVAIVSTDLLIGILIGLVVSVGFILHSSYRRPVRRIVEKHVGGEVLRIELANQVSFLNRASLSRTLQEVPDGGHVLIDATQSDYIHPDVLQLLADFEERTAPAHDIKVSTLGFRRKYQIQDKIQYVDYSSRDVQEHMTPAQALQVLIDGNERFRTGQQLSRNFERQLAATAAGQHPLAVVLSCIDSRTPAELIFDMGIGDLFSVRVAGNIVSAKVLGSMEYGCARAGSNLILVVGHTRCGAVTSTVELTSQNQNARDATGCEHLDAIIQSIAPCIDEPTLRSFPRAGADEQESLVDTVARNNVLNVVERIREHSTVLRNMEADGRIAIVGAMYNVATGKVELVTPAPASDDVPTL
ncbi:MAG: bifunctional SulP family inorganic anion transporter/carbonic anhydrase [Planctomycetaceae bacterium]|nr:bifunctional SulP family inorganic anion transporter/carbonic anhydrase [Planctomycetaceae bacterium]